MAPTWAIVPSPSSSTSANSFVRVSVVRMASAARSPRGPSDAASFGIPTSMGSIGNGTPINPVEHTSTSWGEHPRLSAVTSHIRRASCRPGSPVAALALPELRTTAAARPSTRCSELTWTGAACTRFVVNMAAAGTGR
jgi:hypothetical protein